ncbi:hypothetical protein A2801_01030 [Candidatus Woesebacteria bacterium RIFCSPHIGHO2_01_FULL_41_10]|uniref:Fibronectin type-III domain-containing protein n=1 Tax=Candidatus Woesebacteria bacterium RIFCSPHIGHO2_01_FULL_41_10 TaxID=1802500 RepID=A0A1F7YNP9_9BACT|nr:MAG: hypothetical protein A2801_01030 [Candidatus Woesebacteria bacterium RIFCSPHIGHO2_01_FULL_41_10]
MKAIARIAVLLSLVILVSISPKTVFADGTYANIGTSTGTNGSPDAVSWSQGYPIMIDAYGHYIVPVLPNGSTTYNFAYSNDAGGTWSEQTGLSFANRSSAVYDSVNDKIHVIGTNDTDGVHYKRFVIRRNSSYEIVSIEQDTAFTIMYLDLANSCTGYQAANPIALLKNNGSNGILVAFWSIKKTCSGSSITETRASMRVLSNTSADGTGSNWVALDGTSDEGGAVGPAEVDYDSLYLYSGADTIFQHSAMIQESSSTNDNDIYYFNADEDDTHGMRRLNWDSGSSNWSGSWTARSEFGGNINDSQGYNLKKELLSKPVYASGDDRVYVGIARWLDATNGDTQSLYYVDSSDTITLTDNIYSAGGTHCIYPTFDIAYDSNQDKVYFFYLISGATEVCGHTYYKTYDGSVFSSATAFFTVDSRSVDIPVTYQSRYDDKILLFFRVNNASTPGTPPHDIYFGYVTLNSTETNPTQSVTSPYSATTYSDFYKTCTTLTASQIENTSGGEVALAADFDDDLETPRAPYIKLFANRWETGVWTSGTFDPNPDGDIVIYGAGGAYMLGKTSFTRKILEFRAKFTDNDFQHIGWTDGTGFSSYAMFSTFNDGQLHTRVSNGSETRADLGTSYYGSLHTYKIDWGASDVKFYIDNVLVETTTTNVPSVAMKAIASNNDTVVGSDLSLDWIRVRNYSTTTGTYLSCALDSATTGAVWGTITFDKTEPSSTAATVKTRTSSDNSVWSSYSAEMTSGDTITSAAGRYLQYLVTLGGTSLLTSTLDNITITFASPTPTPSPTPASTATPTPATNNASSAGAPICTNSAPKAPWLYAATTLDKNTIELHFTNPQSADKYAVEYGTDPGKYIFAADDIGSGSYKVNYLASGTTYYFRVRGANGCQPGEWSNEISTTTLNATIQKQLEITQIDIQRQAESLCNIYSVKSGDTLWDISLEMYGKGTDYPKIIALNKSRYPLIDSSLDIGWELNINCDESGENVITSEETRDLPDLTIEVKDQNEDPIKGAKVILHSTPREEFTNNDGIATFKDVEPGQHELVVESDGYEGSQNIFLDDSAKEYKINLTVAKKSSFSDTKVIALVAFLLTVILVLLFIIIRKQKRHE